MEEVAGIPRVLRVALPMFGDEYDWEAFRYFTESLGPAARSL